MNKVPYTTAAASWCSSRPWLRSGAESRLGRSIIGRISVMSQHFFLSTSVASAAENLKHEALVKMRRPQPTQHRSRHCLGGESRKEPPAFSHIKSEVDDKFANGRSPLLY